MFQIFLNPNVIQKFVPVFVCVGDQDTCKTMVVYLYNCT